MSVDIEPFELSFRRPFTVEVSQTLTIKNPNTTPIAFKVKTTAPKQYCVRPNAGRIEPGQDFNVSVLLQAMKQEPPLEAKCRDKFLVQSAPINPDQEFASIVSVLESAGKGNVQERKIRVNWLPSASSEEQGPSAPTVSTPNRKSLVNGTTDTPEANRTFSSPSGAADASTPSSAPPPYQSDDADDDQTSQPSKSAASQVASSASATAQMTYEQLKAKLASVETELLNVKENGLRQRLKPSSDTEKRPIGDVAQAAKQNIEGVPVAVVAVLCLVSFLLAYFFF